MFYTDNPCADAEAHYDALFDVGEAQDAAAERAATQRAAAFIDAATWGADEPLEGGDVADALYEVGCSKPELTDAFFYWAARQEGNPVLRAMVDDVAQEWAQIKARETV